MGMDRQTMLDTFVKRVNGLGRSRQDASLTGKCVYFPAGHPGCAIGCQAGFEQFRRLDLDQLENSGIDVVVDSYSEIADWLGAENMDFAVELQLLHDWSDNWCGLRLRRKPVEEFAARWSLTMPSAEWGEEDGPFGMEATPVS